MAWAVLAALGDADAPRWPLGGMPPAWWPGVTDLERLHAYGGLALAGLGALALFAWGLRTRGSAGLLSLGAAIALSLSAASGLPIGWGGGRALVLPAGLDPALGAAALDALEGLHAAAAAAAALLVLAAVVVAAFQAGSGSLRDAAAALRGRVRPTVGRLAARLGAWAERR